MDPKLFISYSWTTQDHANWVLRLATELVEAGVDVVLDKWNLREGDDAHAFMEQMVADSEIKKVALICDETYVKKANSRSGGVGTETQIITSDIYATQSQSKFVAVVRERDANGNAIVPIYYKSRIYIDFSDDASYSQSFEQLVRWIYDEPIHKKPELGKKPSFLTLPSNSVHLTTSIQFRRAIDAIKTGREYAVPAFAEYLSILCNEMEKLRITAKGEYFDNYLIENIESFLPYRNEFIEMILNVSTYLDTSDTRIIIHRFFERLIPYMDRPANITQWSRWDFDNFRFIIHELFLYTVACYVKNERFESAAYLLENEYYNSDDMSNRENSMVSFVTFSSHLDSLDHRNKRLELRRLSLHSDLLEQRSKGSGIEFKYMMQADFILYMRSLLDQSIEYRWWPNTLLYVGRRSGPFEIFARSKSQNYFSRVTHLLGIKNKTELDIVIKAIRERNIKIPSWEFESFDAEELLAYKTLGTRA